MPNQGGTHDQKAGQQGHKNDDRNTKQQQQAQGENKRQQGSEHRGGSGNFAEDRERASRAGRKGGQQ